MPSIRRVAPFSLSLAIATIMLAHGSSASAQQGTYVHAPYRTYESTYRPPAVIYPVPTYPVPGFAQQYLTTFDPPPADYAQPWAGIAQYYGHHRLMTAEYAANYDSRYGIIPIRRPR